MPQDPLRERFTSICAPVWVADRLAKLARELESHLSGCTSFEQQSSVYLPDGLDGISEQHGIARWKIIARLLREHELTERRKKKHREKKRNERQLTK